MTALGGRRTNGVFPYNVTPEHTARARAIIGPDKWVCVEQKVLLITDPSKAREVARRAMAFYLPLTNYRNNWKRLGFSDEDPVQLSYLVAVGENLSFTHCPADSLEGVLLSHVPQVLSERRCLMIEGRARLREVGILYRSALYPLSDDG